METFVRWAEARDDVRAVLLVGSRARTDSPADAWSDVDLALVVDEPDRYLGDERWVEAFGRPLLTFLEPTAVGRAFERRVLYEGGLDVDIAVFSPAGLEAAVEDPETARVIARGHRVRSSTSSGLPTWRRARPRSSSRDGCPTTVSSASSRRTSGTKRFGRRGSSRAERS